MPLTTEVTKDRQGIIHIGTGTVTGEEFFEASHAALQLVQNTQNFHYEVVDLTPATGLQITEEDLEQITAQDQLAAIYRPNAVILIIAPRDDFFELGQKWERSVRDLGWSTHIARDRTEGFAWLHQNFPPPADETAKPETCSPLPFDSTAR